MMTDATYNALVEDAIHGADRLRGLGVRPENIALVMTQDVYWKAAAQDTNLFTEYAPVTMTRRARLYEYDVGIINEDAETMFKAAVKGMNYHDGMEIGDTIVVDEGVQAVGLFVLDKIDPVCFSDTGLTVTFDIEATLRDIAISVTADATANVIRAATPDDLGWRPPTVWEPMFLPSEHEYRQSGPTFAEINFDELADIVRRAQPGWLEPGSVSYTFSSVKQPKKEPPPKKEERLSPEDTKELDEFLKSFARK